MLPRELPISEGAARAARKAIFGKLADEAPYDVRRGLAAFLQAEGFEVEETAAYKKGNLSIPHFTGPVDRPGWERVEPLCRLISPWKPAPSSTEGGEG